MEIGRSDLLCKYDITTSDNMRKGIDSSKAVVVLGMHRSGTSVLTHALSVLGVYLGDQLISGRPDNPKGFFEDLDLNAFNEELLEAMHCRWDSLFIPSVPAKLEEQFRTSAAALIREHFGALALWGFKDPRVTRLLPFWQTVLFEIDVEPVYVLANRHPMSVAASLALRDAMPRGKALALWALHQAAGLEVLLHHGGLVVDYDLMLEEPHVQLRRLGVFLGQPMETSTPEVVTFASEFLEHGLRHAEHARDGSDLGDGDLGKICRAIYVHLCAWAKLEAHIPNSLVCEARILLEHVHNYFSVRMDWLEMVDTLQSRCDKRIRLLENSVVNRETRIRRLESEITWIANRPLYRIYNKVASTFAKLGFSVRSTSGQ
ncbi:MAG: hypothetical protein JRE23_08975 [Deltaproteobacteria bacterium]|nr:hypothetical protein [Deltaproteobacteria bacterium]